MPRPGVRAGAGCLFLKPFKRGFCLTEAQSIGVISRMIRSIGPESHDTAGEDIAIAIMRAPRRSAVERRGVDRLGVGLAVALSFGFGRVMVRLMDVEFLPVRHSTHEASLRWANSCASVGFGDGVAEGWVA